MKFFNGKFILFCWKFIVSKILTIYITFEIIDVYENVITIQHLVIISDNITSIYSIMRCRNIFMNVLRISTLTNDKRGLRAISCYALSLITKLWKFANGRFNASFISSIIKIHLSCCKRLYYVYIYIQRANYSNSFKSCRTFANSLIQNLPPWWSHISYNLSCITFFVFFILSFKILSTWQHCIFYAILVIIIF